MPGLMPNREGQGHSGQQATVGDSGQTEDLRCLFPLQIWLLTSPNTKRQNTWAYIGRPSPKRLSSLSPLLSLLCNCVAVQIYLTYLFLTIVQSHILPFVIPHHNNSSNSLYLLHLSVSVPLSAFVSKTKNRKREEREKKRSSNSGPVRNIHLSTTISPGKRLIRRRETHTLHTPASIPSPQPAPDNEPTRPSPTNPPRPEPDLTDLRRLPTTNSREEPI